MFNAHTTLLCKLQVVELDSRFSIKLYELDEERRSGRAKINSWAYFRVEASARLGCFGATSGYLSPLEEEIIEYEDIHSGSQEAVERLGRAANNWFVFVE